MAVRVRGAKNPQKIKADLERVRVRLEHYYGREEEMLSQDGVQSYGTGAHNLSRYNTDLKVIKDAIKELEGKAAELEAILYGGGARRAFAIVPRDL